MNTLIAVPMYNCSKQILRVYKSLEKLDKILSFKLVFIDNNSKDSTVVNLSKLKSTHPFINETLILRNDYNYGLGGTHKVAFSIAIQEDIDYLVILHGDDQASVEDILPMLKKAKKFKSTILGSRFMEGSQRVGYQFSRIVGNRCLNFLFSLITFKRTLDLGSGLNIFKVKDFEPSELHILTDSFNFNVELLLNIFKTNKAFSFFPILWREEDQLSNARNFSVAWSMLISLFKWRLNVKKKSNSFDEYTFKVVD